MMVLLSWVNAGGNLSTFGTFWCQRAFVCFCSPYDAKAFFFFLSCGKTALFLKSKSRASALMGENLPRWLALRCAILGRRTQSAPAFAENGGLSWNSVCFLPAQKHTHTPLRKFVLIVLGVFIEFNHVCFKSLLNCSAQDL